MSMLEQLFDLQQLDTLITQLRHRHDHLPEAAEVAGLRSEVARVSSSLVAIDSESTSIAGTVAECEARVEVIRAATARLNAQMKTVIAPREAEALQHEIANFAAESSALDDAALAALDRSEELDRMRSLLQAECDDLTVRVADAEATLRQAQAAVKGEIEDVEARRAAATALLDGAIVAAYEQRRQAHSGVAVAKLLKTTCGGCHIDLSTTEIEQLRRAAEPERECPNCARWLVL